MTTDDDKKEKRRGRGLEMFEKRNEGQEESEKRLCGVMEGGRVGFEEGDTVDKWRSEDTGEDKDEELRF